MSSGSPALSVDVVHTVASFRLEATFSHEGGIAVLVGPSGAGKSMTLALISGTLRPQRGRITIGGRVVADTADDTHVPSQERRLGVVHQDGLLLPHRTALDNVALAVRGGRRAERRRRATEALEQVEAGELAGRRPGQLSGGQRQRVALARALVGEPSLMLLDEPLSALDSPARAELRAVIRRVVDTSEIPAMLVTHDEREAAALGDRFFAVQAGTVRPVQTAQ